MYIHSLTFPVHYFSSTRNEFPPFYGLVPCVLWSLCNLCQSALDRSVWIKLYHLSFPYLDDEWVHSVTRGLKQTALKIFIYWFLQASAVYSLCTLYFKQPKVNTEPPPSLSCDSLVSPRAFSDESYLKHFCKQTHGGAAPFLTSSRTWAKHHLHPGKHAYVTTYTLMYSPARQLPRVGVLGPAAGLPDLYPPPRLLPRRRRAL